MEVSESRTRFKEEIIMDIRIFRGFLDLGFRSIRTSPEDILAYRSREEENILSHYADIGAQR